MVPRENQNNAYAKFGGTNKEYYGIFESGLFEDFISCYSSLYALDAWHETWNSASDQITDRRWH